LRPLMLVLLESEGVCGMFPNSKYEYGVQR
jgi:hypothetical protein